MSQCSSCGAPVPDGQAICSMCYGDPYYGSDGYYLAELERAAQADAERQAEDMLAEQAYEDNLPFSGDSEEAPF